MKPVWAAGLRHTQSSHSPESSSPTGRQLVSMRSESSADDWRRQNHHDANEEVIGGYGGINSKPHQLLGILYKTKVVTHRGEYTKYYGHRTLANVFLEKQ